MLWYSIDYVGKIYGLVRLFSSAYVFSHNYPESRRIYPIQGWLLLDQSSTKVCSVFHSWYNSRLRSVPLLLSQEDLVSCFNIRIYIKTSFRLCLCPVLEIITLGMCKIRLPRRTNLYPQTNHQRSHRRIDSTNNDLLFEYLDLFSLQYLQHKQSCGDQIQVFLLFGKLFLITTDSSHCIFSSRNFCLSMLIEIHPLWFL